jgi:putative intracellular protease/amidase
MSLANFVRRTACPLVVAFAFTAPHIHASEQDRILIVVSSEGRDQGKTRPGFEMDEFAQAYLIFRDNGLSVDVASPAGGAVEADKYNPKEPFNARLLTDADAMHKLAGTRATRDVRSEDYDAVYVVGGKGAMFDLPGDPALKTLLSTVYERGGIIAAVCHGPAALVDVRLRDGSLLVSGRTLTGFSNEEEAIFGKRWSKEFRFQLEDAMRERGAHWQEAPLMMPRLVVDGRLITGQNPYSTPAVAEAIVRATGRTPIVREPWRDENSMALVQRLLAGQADEARSELAVNRARFHVELIGMLGYYQLQAAHNDAAVRDALSVMQLAEPYMSEPQLKLAIADAHWRLGDTAQARALTGKLLETKPDMDEAKALLKRMNH